MVRFLSKITGVFFGITSLFFFSTAVFAYTPPGTELDQVLSNGCSGFDYIKVHTLIQTFTPTKNRVDSIGVKVNTYTTPSADITAKLYNGATLLATDTQTVTHVNMVDPNPPYEGTWLYFNLPDATVTAGSVYKIALTTTSNDAYWMATTTDAYSGGKANVDGSDQSWDLCFASYGYDAAAPAPTPTPTPTPTTTTTPTTSTTPTTTSPKTSTSTPAATTKKSTPAAAKADTTSTETKGIFSSPMLIGVVVVLLLLVAGLIVWLMMKKKKPEEKKDVAKPAENPPASPEPTPAPPTAEEKPADKPAE